MSARTDTTPREPLIKDRDDSGVVSAYWHHRDEAAKWADMARQVTPRSRWGRTVANRWGYHDRLMQIAVAVARQRGIVHRLHTAPTA